MTGSMKDLGERGLINLLARRFASDLPAGTTGIGDDCAVFPGKAGELSLVTTDLLVEGVHFRRSRLAPEDLGHKALAVNLSDIAAMGGTPHSAYLSLAIPLDLDARWLEDCIAGLGALAEESGTLLLGGDTTRSPGPLVINLGVLGRVAPDRVKYRAGAKAGDALCVTGTLGDSAAGLCLLKDQSDADDQVEAHLVNAHQRPRPHLEEGQFLAGQSPVHAMMDISDGLNQDLGRIMERSSCGARVELTRLPISPQLRRASRERGWDLERMAATGGEDYCLLTAIEAASLDQLSAVFQERFGRELVQVGEVMPQSQGLTFWSGVRRVELGEAGFLHFGA